jgi:hypothetical protein
LTSQLKIVPVFVLLVLAGAIGYGLLPFRFADSIRCEAPLMGAGAIDKEADIRGFIKPEEDCAAAGKSRLIKSAIAALLATMAGTAMLGLRPMTTECMSGNHDDCHEYWTNMAGGLGQRLGCQCECHASLASFSSPW